MNMFRLQIITTKATLVDREVISLDVPAPEGRMTILANHQPQLCALEDGELTLIDSKGRETWNIKTGFMKVRFNSVSITLREACLKK
jgi:F-type H+-transporting ATPase subunit epsilon